MSKNMPNIYRLRISTIADRVADKLKGHAYTEYAHQKYRVVIETVTGRTFIYGKYSEVLGKLWAMYDVLELAGIG